MSNQVVLLIGWLRVLSFVSGLLRKLAIKLGDKGSGILVLLQDKIVVSSVMIFEVG